MSAAGGRRVWSHVSCAARWPREGPPLVFSRRAQTLRGPLAPPGARASPRPGGGSAGEGRRGPSLLGPLTAIRLRGVYPCGTHTAHHAPKPTHGRPTASHGRLGASLGFPQPSPTMLPSKSTRRPNPSVAHPLEPSLAFTPRVRLHAFSTALRFAPRRFAVSPSQQTPRSAPTPIASVRPSLSVTHRVSVRPRLHAPLPFSAPRRSSLRPSPLVALLLAASPLPPRGPYSFLSLFLRSPHPRRAVRRPRTPCHLAVRPPPHRQPSAGHRPPRPLWLFPSLAVSALVSDSTFQTRSFARTLPHAHSRTAPPPPHGRSTLCRLSPLLRSLARLACSFVHPAGGECAPPTAGACRTAPALGEEGAGEREGAGRAKASEEEEKVQRARARRETENERGERVQEAESMRERMVNVQSRPAW